MKLKEQKWATCKCCNQRTHIIQGESYGCDTCKIPIDKLLHPKQSKYSEVLELTIFWISQGTDATRYHFCSWGCMIKKLLILLKRKDIDFITLPTISFDKKIRGQSVKEIASILKKALDPIKGRKI